MAYDLMQLFARLAVGCTFLSAVADRYGFWGAYGTPNVSWGDFAHFTAYTARVNAFLPQAAAPTLAIASTVLEAAFGIALVLGVRMRLTSFGSAILLGLFALAMTISFGIKAPLNLSVFSGCAAAWRLATVRRYRWSIDELYALKQHGRAAR